MIPAPGFIRKHNTTGIHRWCVSAPFMSYVICIRYRAFKLVVCELGMPTVRFHDLRHSYAVVSLKSGDDVKTVQENLGHATAAFTLDVYGHVTEKMKKDSADRMQAFIKSVS